MEFETITIVIHSWRAEMLAAIVQQVVASDRMLLKRRDHRRRECLWFLEVELSHVSRK
jgi:hypothetical protein